MKRVICKSGTNGWESRLNKVFNDFTEFESNCEVFNLHRRLGYKTPKTAWKSNPIIQGSVNPSDYCRVKK